MWDVRYTSRRDAEARRRFSWCQLLIVVVWFILLIDQVDAWVAPYFGLGAVLFSTFQPRVIVPISKSENKRADLVDVSDFFVDAFWTGKTGGGARKLNRHQLDSLLQSQLAEFNKRYGGKRASELLVCRSNHPQGPIMACVGVEVDRIPDQNIKGPGTTYAPLMSNLAVGRAYRRRGIAEQLVRAVEAYVQKEWSFDTCYLYVEERNVGAFKLYQKLGYRKVWRDDTAQTLLPTPQGDLTSSRTVIVCMKKDLKAPSSWLPRVFSR